MPKWERVEVVVETCACRLDTVLTASASAEYMYMQTRRSRTERDGRRNFFCDVVQVLA